jgi:ubiquitin C-terminal hydrolase
MNSCLQLIIHNKIIQRIILNDEDIPIVNLLRELITSYFKNNDINVKKVYKYFSTKYSVFDNNIQSDSSELLLHILDELDTQLKGNVITDNFDMEEQCHIKCKLSNCNTKSITKSKNRFLIFDSNSSNKSLNTMYRQYKQRVKLDEDNRWFCSKCDKKRIASKRICITKWPKYLFICIRRLTEKKGKYYKDNSSLDIPLLWRHDYNLIGFIIHSGSLSGGHYVSACNIENEWILFDDNNCSKISDISDYTKQAVVLLYKKIEITTY